MATKKSAKSDDNGGLEPGAEAAYDTAGDFGIQTTGRQIVTFVDTSTAGVRSALSAMKKEAGVSKVSHARDFKAAYSAEDAESGDAVVLDDLGIAVITADDLDKSRAVASFSAATAENVIVEPEFVNFAFDEDLDADLTDRGDTGEDLSSPPAPGVGPAGVSQSFLRGYREGVDALVRSLGAAGAAGAAAAPEAAGFEAAGESFQDTSSSTYGLKATGVLSANTTGAGIKVAVLDTGFDLRHPDYAGRAIQSSSFIPGETVQDGNGHGTHCIGTSCGPKRPGVGPRYGIASGAQIFAGKVLSNAGSGGDGNILAGINWAVQNGCQVISMSLGRRVRRGERPQTNYETAGRRALDAGSLIIAAAGNDSSRPFVTVPVSSPANAATIAAVAAIDRFLQIARFSNQGINPAGGEINLAGPGVDVLSSWPMPIRLRSISGTSMATPHVAGVAALVAEESRRFRGIPLYREMRSRARRLSLPRADVGNGLVQA